jgi:hypothetical protein
MRKIARCTVVTKGPEMALEELTAVAMGVKRERDELLKACKVYEGYDDMPNYAHRCFNAIAMVESRS